GEAQIGEAVGPLLAIPRLARDDQPLMILGQAICTEQQLAVGVGSLLKAHGIDTVLIAIRRDRLLLPAEEIDVRLGHRLARYGIGNVVERLAVELFLEEDGIADPDNDPTLV